MTPKLSKIKASGAKTRCVKTYSHKKAIFLYLKNGKNVFLKKSRASVSFKPAVAFSVSSQHHASALTATSWLPARCGGRGRRYLSELDRKSWTRRCFFYGKIYMCVLEEVHLDESLWESPCWWHNGRPIYTRPGCQRLLAQNCARAPRNEA